MFQVYLTFLSLEKFHFLLDYYIKFMCDFDWMQGQNGVSLISEIPSVAIVQELHDQFWCGNDYSFKVCVPEGKKKFLLTLCWNVGVPEHEYCFIFFREFVRRSWMEGIAALTKRLHIIAHSCLFSYGYYFWCCFSCAYVFFEMSFEICGK